MRILLASLLVLVQILFGQEEFSLVNLSEGPWSRIHGSINVITGNWVDQTTHDQTTGPDSYAVAHTYISENGETGSLADGWDFFHPSELEVFQPEGITYTRNIHSSSNDITVRYKDSGGGSISFTGTSKGKKFLPNLTGTGYVCVGSISHPNRRDHHNTCLYWHSPHDQWEVLLGDGTQRIYTKKHDHHSPTSENVRYYHICSEHLPSGNYRMYSYKKDDLEAIETLSSDKRQVINRVNFKKQDNTLLVTTSDGLTTTFYFKKLHDHPTTYVVTKIVRPGKGELQYEYSEKSSHHSRRITTKKAASGRFEAIRFYHGGENHLLKDKIRVKGSNSFLKGRVKQIWTKTLPDDAPKCLYSLLYKEHTSWSSTTVKTSDGTSYVYFWNKARRPVWVSAFQGGLVFSQRFRWNSQGELLAQIFCDEHKNPIFAKQFVYDENRNVIKEILRGSFNTLSKLSFDALHNPLGGEVIVKEAQYDALGRKTAEKDPIGNWTYYAYEGTKDLIASKFTCEGTSIKKREFFTYDAAAVLVESIVDNGSSKKKDNFHGVTYRTIDTITSRKTVPNFGAPISVEHKVWTPQGVRKLSSEHFHYDSHGNCIRKELFDSAGKRQKVWQYSYDAFHRLTRFIDPVGYSEQYAYDSSGRRASIKTFDRTITYTYDLFDRIIKETTQYANSSTITTRSYNLTGTVTGEVDFRGRQSTVIKDCLGRPTQQTSAAIFTEAGIRSPQSTVKYQGYLSTSTSPTGAVTKTLFSSFGKPIIVTSPTGAKTVYRYDKKGRLIEQKDPSGCITKYEYDLFDRPIRTCVQGASTSVTTCRYDGSHLVEEKTPTTLLKISYDDYGRKHVETHLDLLTKKTYTIKTYYDSLHRPSRIVHQDFEERLVYDAADRVVAKKRFALDGTLLSSSSTVYDPLGRVIEQHVLHSSGDAVTKSTYGTYGLLSHIAYPDGTSSHISYEVVLGAHNHRLLKKTTTNPQGVTTEELLDAHDKPCSVVMKDPFGNIISKTSTTYNIFSKPVSIVEDALGAPSPSKNVTEFSYDNLGQLVCCNLFAHSQEGSTWKYRYDKCGRKIEEQKPSGIKLVSSYDSQNRLIKIVSSDNSIHYTYTYNVQNLPETIFNNVHQRQTVRKYDGFGHLISETLENGLTLSFDISSEGHLSSITYPDNSVTQYLYKDGRLSSIKRNALEYSVLSRDLSGIITSAHLPGNSGDISTSIDRMGRWTSLQHPAFTERRTLFSPTGLCVTRSINDTLENFSYDYLGQLTNDNGKPFSYDSIYRCHNHEGISASYASFRLTSLGPTTYTYDADGRRVNNSSYTYTYDAFDRLISVHGNNVHCEYSYDAYNRRMSKKSSSEELYFWYDDCELGSCDTSKRITSLRVLGEGLKKDIGSSVLFEINNTPYIPIHDLSGNTRVLLDLQGNVVERLSYSAFKLLQPASLTPWTFASKRQDPETHLCYFGARYYDQESATWLTLDPLGHSAGPNLYAYTKNNPLVNLDYFGLLSETTSHGFFDRVVDFFCSSSDTHVSPQPQDAPRQDSEKVAISPREICLENGQKIIEGVRYSNQVLCYPQGNSCFFEQFAGQNLGSNVACLTRGICTTLYETCEMAGYMMEVNRDLRSVILLYNETHGSCLDLGEAAANSVGKELKVGTDLLNGFSKFLDGCLALGIDFKASFFAHSQGAAINKNLLAHSEFLERGKYLRFVNDRVNFGGAVVDTKALNYMATRDPVACFSTTMYRAEVHMGVVQAGADIRWLESSGETPVSSHYFDHAPYKGALTAYLQGNPQ
jgi:RHS repeat-associated protein